MRVLVAGGAGFIGSHLCTSLVGTGHEVFCVDNLCTGHVGNVAHLAHHALFHMIHHDVTVPIEVDVDQIYNLACPASPVQYQRHPVQTTRACVHGSINMLDLARFQNARILLASTSEVYGDPLVHPQTESYWGNVNPNGPRACYDEGKRCAETLFFDYRRQYGLSSRVARIFNTYGPRMLPNDGRVISNFVVQALTGRPLTVYGAGSQTRSFCYVDDLVRGLVALMALDDDELGPVNLGNPKEHTIEQVARLIVAFTGADVPVVHVSALPDDPLRRCPDITLARDVLDWVPAISLEQGVSRTVEYFRYVLAGEQSIPPRIGASQRISANEGGSRGPVQ